MAVQLCRGIINVLLEVGSDTTAGASRTDFPLRLQPYFPRKLTYYWQNPPFLAEVNKVVKEMASGKASGADTIPAKVFKSGGPQLITVLHELFLNMWEQEAIS